MIMGWYIVITEEMVELGLRGNDLIVFATIHGFSQMEQGCFHGSAAYLANVCGVEHRTIQRILKRLTDEGFLKKTDIYKEGVKFCTYQTSVKLSQGTTFCRRGVRQFAAGGYDNLPHNNKSDNVVDKSTTKNIKIEREDAPASPSPSRRFTPPTVDEVREYCRSRHNAVNAEAFVAFYTSNGWKVGKNTMKDWKAAVITWEKRDQTHTTPVFTGYTNTRTTAR